MRRLVVRKTRLFEHSEFSPDGFSYSPPLVAPFDAIIQLSRRRAAAAPLSRMKYFMCGGGIWRRRGRRRSRFYMNAAATKRSGAGAIFYAESSPLVIVPFPRSGAIPCVLYFRIFRRGCVFPCKIPPNISPCLSAAALPPHCPGLRGLSEGYFLSSRFQHPNP